MENIQREVIGILLERIYTLGLIGKPVYEKAENLLHSQKDFPQMFWLPPRGEKEGQLDECAENPQ